MPLLTIPHTGETIYLSDRCTQPGPIPSKRETTAAWVELLENLSERQAHDLSHQLRTLRLRLGVDE